MIGNIKIKREGEQMAKFISLFAGVGGFDLGMEQAGHECVAQVEWDKNAAGVLKHRWPNVPLFCDVSKVSADDLPDADFITYGFPCQDLSVAGKREGLDGKRSGLFYEATRLIRELRTRGCGLRFAVAENVGGLFSADDGVALARCIRELLDSGACETGWRLVDSQYFGVAQRRKRVFIVSDFGGESVDEILAITESLPGYPAPSREAGKGTAGDATKGVGEGGKCDCDPNGTAGTLLARDYKGLGNQDLETGRGLALQAQSTGSDPDLMATLCAKDNEKVGSNQWVKEGKAILAVDFYNNSVNPNTSQTLSSAASDKNHIGGVIEQKAIPIHDMATRHAGKRGEKSDGKGNGLGVGQEGDPSPTLTKGDHHAVVSWNGDTTPKASEDVSVTLRSQQGGEGVGVAFQKSELRLKDKIELKQISPTLKAETKQGDTEVNVLQGGEGVGVAHSFYPTAGRDFPIEKELSLTVKCGSSLDIPSPPGVLKENLTVRRLTPIECERLQGFPDNWTSEKMELILEGNEWKATGKVVKQADGPRYKAMGNAVTVNVAEWIGKQIGKVLS
jgi:DNA (cytosine-5)-methyltransferase 1